MLVGKTRPLTTDERETHNTGGRGGKIDRGPNKIMCYSSVGQQIAVLKGTPDDRAAACARGEAEYLKSCLYGAGVTMVMPPELAPVLALGDDRKD